MNLAREAELVQRRQRRVGRSRPQRQDSVRILVAVQVRHHLVLDLGRVLAAIDHLVAELHAKGIGVALAAIDRGRIGDVVVDAQELGDARRLGLLAGTKSGVVFRLAHMQQGAELLGLLVSARIDRDDGNALVDGIGDGAAEHVEVGDGDDDAVRVGRRRLLDDAGHVGQVAGRRIAIVDGHAHLLAGDPDRVFDRVPPAVAVRRVADEDELFALRRGDSRARGQNDRRQRGGCERNDSGFHGLLPFHVRRSRPAAICVHPGLRARLPQIEYKFHYWKSKRKR